MMIRRTLCLLAAVAVNGLVIVPHAAAASRLAAASFVPTRSCGATMGLMETMSRFIFGPEPRSKSGSKASAKSRIKLVLAHDRSGIDTETMGKIRAEILQVVSKYLVIEEEGINFDLLTDEKMTLLTATLPVIRSPAERRVATVLEVPLIEEPVTAE